MPVRDSTPKFLMDQEEGNLGGYGTVEALACPMFGPGPGKRILEFNGDSKFGKVLTLGLSSFWVSGGADPGLSGFGGPVVATVEFGNGGAYTTVEVDVPCGSTGNGSRNLNLENGVLLSLPASAVRVIARNDGGVIPLNRSDGLVGNRRLDGQDPDDPDAFAPSVMNVKAFIVEGTRGGSLRPHRFLPLGRFTPDAGIGATGYRIPSFARRVQFWRDPMIAINYSFAGSIDPGYGPIFDAGTVGVGVTSPIIEVPSQATILIVSTGASVFKSMFADFELEV